MRKDAIQTSARTIARTVSAVGNLNFEAGGASGASTVLFSLIQSPLPFRAVHGLRAICVCLVLSRLSRASSGAGIANPRYLEGMRRAAQAATWTALGKRLP